MAFGDAAPMVGSVSDMWFLFQGTIIFAVGAFPSGKTTVAPFGAETVTVISLPLQTSADHRQHFANCNHVAGFFGAIEIIALLVDRLVRARGAPHFGSVGCVFSHAKQAFASKNTFRHFR